MNKKLDIDKNCHITISEQAVYITFFSVARQGIFVLCFYEVGLIFFSFIKKYIIPFLEQKIVGK